MGQVPMLVVGGTTKIVQSKAIARYAAAKTGLMGATPEEAADVDAFCELFADMKTAIDGAKDDDAKKALLSEKLPAMLAIVEKLAGATACVGGKLSLADVTLYHLVTHALAPSIWGPGAGDAVSAIKASPKAGAIIAAVAALPGIAAWEAARPARSEVF